MNKYTFEELWGRLPQSIRDECSKCEQDPIWHKEGNVDVHIKLVFESVNTNFDGDPDLLISAIFHDLGKPETKKVTEKGKISNIGHELKCEKYILMYIDLYSDITTNKEKVIEICNNHMKAHVYKNNVMKKRTKRQNFESLKYFNDIMNFATCDDMGKQI